MTCQTWIRLGISAASLALNCRAAADKNNLPPVIAVKVAAVHPLPFFCIAEGLGEGKTPAKLPEGDYIAGDICKPTGKKPAKAASGKEPRYIAVPPGNADDIATLLQPQLPAAGTASATFSTAAATGTASASAISTVGPTFTKFALTATADKRSEIVFCRDRVCSSEEVKALRKVIDTLAKPKYGFFKDYTIDSEKTGKALAKAVPVMNGKLSAEVIDKTTLRVESSKPLTAAEISLFEARLNKDQTGLASSTVPKEVQKDLNGVDPDSEVISVDLPYFCQSNDLKILPVPAPSTNTCEAPLRKVQANNFDVIVAAVNSALSKSSQKLSVSRDGSHILIACDTKCSGDSLSIAQTAAASAARPVPLMVKDIEVPRGTAGIAAAALNIAPLSAVELTETTVRLGSDTLIPENDLAAALERVRQRGFGQSEAPLLQRMFYHSAEDVVGSLLTTPGPGTPATLGGDAASAPMTGNSAPSATATPAASSTAGSGGTTVTINNSPPAAGAPAPSAPSPGPAPTGTLGQGMTAVDDSVVFTDTSSTAAVKQRARLLTLLDLPRPEVLMNLWSFQASSPDGKEMARSLQKARDLVNANNDALQHAIDYGWAYLSRAMKNPTYFDKNFHDYLTQRFVADTAGCEASDPAAGPCLTTENRKQWDLCPAGRYCLGYEGAFDPMRRTLSGILLGMMAAKDTSQVVLTTIGCMEGKFEVYKDCFPDRDGLATQLPAGQGPVDPVQCLKEERAKFLEKNGAGTGAIDVEPVTEKQKRKVLSCDILDRAAVAAQRACGLAITLPLSCFTIQTAKSFLPDPSFSTFRLQQLNSLAEQDLAELVNGLPREANKYSATSVGLLRSAVADFLFNYKVAAEYPSELGTYSLPHSAQELNAQFNPLVVAFNQDVAALSRTLLDEIQDGVPNQNHFFQLWRHNKSYIADGLMTVRGISGIESLVDTDTQSSFDSTQAQTLGAVLSAITGGGSSAAAASGPTNTNTNSITINPDGSSSGGSSGGSGGVGGAGISCSNGSAVGSPLCAVANLLKGGTTATAIATALAAVTPVQTHSMIGRQLTLDIIPHTLPGASSAELDVRLWAQEDSAPTIYSTSGSSSTDFQSRVARHNVATRVRVESVKLFDLSTFTAMVQRPRAKLPIVPPFIEIPLIGSLLSVPLPAARVYHSSSAIISALIVPTAADLAYGLRFQADRAVFREDKRFSHLDFSLRVLTSQHQLPETAQIYEFHKKMEKCLARSEDCGSIKFSDLPPER